METPADIYTLLILIYWLVAGVMVLRSKPERKTYVLVLALTIFVVFSALIALHLPTS